MRIILSIVLASAVAGCVVGGDEETVGDNSGNENELAVNEIVNAGEALRVTASSLNLRSSASTLSNRASEGLRSAILRRTANSCRMRRSSLA